MLASGRVMDKAQEHIGSQRKRQTVVWFLEASGTP